MEKAKSGLVGSLVAEARYSGAFEPKGGKNALLVLNANLASPTQKTADSQRAGQRKRERLKWSRLASAREILWGFDADPKTGKKAIRPKLAEHRTSKCMWVNITFAVEHWRVAGKSAHFRNVYTCGSRCACAVCSEKIWKDDQREIQNALGTISQKGLYTVMVSFTLQHDRFVRCADSLQILRKALKGLKMGKGWQLIKRRYGLLGSIAVMENTFSFENGHHPHRHEILVMSKPVGDVELVSLQKAMSDRYLRCLADAGGRGLEGVALHVRRADDYVAEYVAKVGHEPQVKRWGASNELTSYAQKVRGAQVEHYKMFQLLDLFSDGNIEAGNAWAEYVEAFTGQAMVRWSQGLRELLEMPKAKTDEQKAQANESESKVFALYTQEMYRKVRRRPFDVLDASIDMSFDAFREYLQAKGMDAECPVFELVDNGFDD